MTRYDSVVDSGDLPCPRTRPPPTIRNPVWYGWIPDQRDHLYAKIYAAPKKLPAQVDLRKTCSAIKDQGQLGSCTANALVGALEFLERKQKQRVQNLSRLFVYHNERVIEHSVNQDAGAMLRDGIKTLAKQGVCTMPYAYLDKGDLTSDMWTMRKLGE